MAQEFKIHVRNNNKPYAFAFFQAAPKIKSVKSDSDSSDAGTAADADAVFTNVWFKLTAPTNGEIEVTTHKEFFAWAGTVGKPAAIGTIVTTGTAMAAKIGLDGKKGSTFDCNVTDGTITLKEKGPNADQGAFEIITGDFKVSDNVLIGMAKQNPQAPGFHIPTGLINATGSMKYIITPINEFYISTFDGKQGEIFDYKAVSLDAGKISFNDNPGKTEAFVIYTDKGKWEITYA